MQTRRRDQAQTTSFFVRLWLEPGGDEGQ